jgi:hypothetical protein
MHGHGEARQLGCARRTGGGYLGAQDHGLFSMYSSYLVQCSYATDSLDRNLLYFWHGLFCNRVQRMVWRLEAKPAPSRACPAPPYMHSRASCASAEAPRATVHASTPRVVPALHAATVQVADLLARGLEERTGQAPLQMDVFQGKEPAHFLSLFNSAMVHRPAQRPGPLNRWRRRHADGAGGSRNRNNRRNRAQPTHGRLNPKPPSLAH